MGKYEYEYWKSEGTVDVQEMVSLSFDWLHRQYGETRESLQAKYDDICNQCREIIAMETEGKLAREIGDELEDLFEDFSGLYRLVTEPSGEFSAFEDDFNDCVEDIRENELSILLG